MLGIIVTGHGGFASGIQKNVKMLSGVDIVALDFTGEGTLEELDEEIIQAVNSLNDCEAIVIFTDLAGGTPYNRSVLTTAANPKVRVLSGANIPMLLDAAIKRMSEEEIEDIDALCEGLISTAKEGIKKFVLAVQNDDDFDEEDGI